jgi:hypothetical protein
MNSDVIIGYDGRARCPWAGAGDTANARAMMSASPSLSALAKNIGMVNDHLQECFRAVGHG